MKTDKREVSTLVPYRKIGNRWFFFMQKRDENAKRLPSWYGFFGGGLESGESPEEALRREIKEELDINIDNYEFLGRFESMYSINNVFIIEVSENFENEVEVLEGQYGKFLSSQELIESKEFADHDKLVVIQLSDFLDKR